MAALLMKVCIAFYSLDKSIDNKGKCLNKYIDLSYFFVNNFIYCICDGFTFADMKFRSHCHVMMMKIEE